MVILIVKLVPVLGTVVLIGAVVQVFLGYQVAGGSPGLRDTHMLIGIIGLVLVVALAGIPFRAKTGTIYSKVTMVVLAIIVLIQVIMGFQILGGGEALVTSHQATGFLIVILSLIMGGISFGRAKRQSRPA